MNIIRNRSIALLAIIAVAIALAPTATAVPQPAVGNMITYLRGSIVYIANADGTSEQIYFSGVRTISGWSPDGSRFVAEMARGDLATVRAERSASVMLNAPGTDPAWAPFGAIFYSSQGQLKFVGADGGWWRGSVFEPTPGAWDMQPTVNRSGRVVFTRVGGGQNGLYRYDLGSDAPPVLMVAGGTQASFAPSGDSIAYVQNGQLWVANADGSTPRQLTQDTGTTASDPTWSPDGTKILFVRGADALTTIDVRSGTETALGLSGTDPSWQPVANDNLVRVWGQDHVDTAVAASQYNYVTAGEAEAPGRRPARAVVLSRDDTYLDALVGSAFAVKESAPLLVTNRLALDSRVEREINRVLGGSGTVYLLGGELALAPAVQNRLQALGYQVERIWGQTHFDTAVEINRRITPNPRYAIVATGTNYYDALGAGAAAGATGDTVIVLTDHNRMPAASANYLNTLTPANLDPPGSGTVIVTAGGPGDAALADGWHNSRLWPGKQGDLQWSRLVGNNEMDTGLLIANFFFAAPSVAALATNHGWFDALTGGAMIGANGGPLLIADPYWAGTAFGIYPPVVDYLSRNSGSLREAVLLGGPVAMPEGVKWPVGNAIAMPGHWQYSEVPPAPGAAAQTRQESRDVAVPPSGLAVNRSGSVTTAGR